MRYYLVPGAHHANFGTPAFAAAWDSLSVLENWVDGGEQAAKPITTDMNYNRTRPLREYPTWPKYHAGDPNMARSFVCTR
ncbi:tannase/feruloyl esterase family alpha/beta hydrolase [Streptomyces chartreusis]|uniref:tannase/feruloyl esterase family alpha/beta hydrolase n=1 Tax=Streptomyces chartreusis TaxID=1969 RepID=UPI003697A8DD